MKNLNFPYFFKAFHASYSELPCIFPYFAIMSIFQGQISIIQQSKNTNRLFSS